MNKLIIFDVDHTLVTTVSGDTFRRSAHDWEWLPNRLARCLALREEGFLLAIATNQAGVAFEWSSFTEKEMQEETEKIGKGVGACHVSICYSTPNPRAMPEYHVEGDIRRKPGPGMLYEAMLHCNAWPNDTVFVGDREEDKQAALAAGINFILADDFFGNIK